MKALAILGVLSLVGLVLLFADRAPTGLDAWGEKRDPPGQPWHATANFLDAVGHRSVATALVAIGFAFTFVLRRWRPAALVVLGSVLTPALAEVLKPVIGRRIHGHWLCFPSGHVAFATSLALSVAIAAVGGWPPSLARPAVVGSAVAVGAPVAWAEVCLNHHYLTDTIGGAATAFALVPTLALLLDRVLVDRPHRA